MISTHRVLAFTPYNTYIILEWCPSTRRNHLTIEVEATNLGYLQLNQSNLFTSLSLINIIRIMAPIGFIGLGIMGEGMAARLISEGVAGSDDVPLIVWNRTSSKCTALKDKFPDKNIEMKGTAKEVVESCGITFSMLSTPEASNAVFEADNGTLAGVCDGKFIIDCATLAEGDMKRMSEQVKSKGG